MNNAKPIFWTIFFLVSVFTSILTKNVWIGLIIFISYLLLSKGWDADYLVKNRKYRAYFIEIYPVQKTCCLLMFWCCCQSCPPCRDHDVRPCGYYSYNKLCKNSRLLQLHHNCISSTHLYVYSRRTGWNAETHNILHRTIN